ncbi:MAG TPA: hypothetical protein PLX56_12725, partial [bacterium]|nr:hypothetical protein [bacterium]
DVDTFLLDSETYINLQEHLKKGNKSMDITLSVNQDAIFTNFMVLSVDNKGSNFDIPPEAADTTKSKLNFPVDREKHFCACPSFDGGETPDYICEGREFYFFIKVQNWGDDTSGEVFVSDDIDVNLDYIPGSTEMASVYDDSTDSFIDWQSIPDNEDGSFPLSGDGYKVKDKMSICSKSSWDCTDTVLIRFKVKPKTIDIKTPKIENIAYIKDSKGGAVYKTNRSYPLYLRPTSCISDCLSPSPELCGGVNNGFVPDDDVREDSDNYEDFDDELVHDEDIIKDVADDSNHNAVNDEDVKSSGESDGCGCSLI